ncbi:MAG: SET domain-containing protein [Pseudomonadota bacterium]
MKHRINNSELRELVFAASSEIHGTGLFAAASFSKGDYIGSYHGPRAKRNGIYVLWVFDPDDETDIYGVSGRNLLRYLNHSRPGNTEFEGTELYARAAIRKGDELTFDYGDEWRDDE